MNPQPSQAVRHAFADEETIIDLIDVIPIEDGEADDEIIDLTDIVPPEEEIIELTDIMAKATTVEDEIVDLTDVVAPASEEIALTETVDPGQADPEEIIELTDIVAPGEEMAAPSPDFERADSDEVWNPDPAATVLFDELDSASPAALFEAEPDAFATPGPTDELEFGDVSFSDMDTVEPDSGDIADALAMRLEAGIADVLSDPEELDFSLTTEELSEAIDQFDEPVDAIAFEETKTGQPVPDPMITEAMLEAAVERVIRERFSEKIDLLIETALERTLTSEIDRIKARLFDDEDPAD